MLAAKEAFDAFLARLVWEGPAGAHGPTGQREEPEEDLEKVGAAVLGPGSDRQVGPCGSCC